MFAMKYKASIGNIFQALLSSVNAVIFINKSSLQKFTKFSVKYCQLSYL